MAVGNSDILSGNCVLRKVASAGYGSALDRVGEDELRNQTTKGTGNLLNLRRNFFVYITYYTYFIYFITLHVSAILSHHQVQL
jgi:hypothetical protein